MHTLLDENHLVGFAFCIHCPNAGDLQRGKKKKPTCRELTVGELILLQPSHIPTERKLYVDFFLSIS